MLMARSLATSACRAAEQNSPRRLHLADADQRLPFVPLAADSNTCDSPSGSPTPARVKDAQGVLANKVPDWISLLSVSTWPVKEWGPGDCFCPKPQQSRCASLGTFTPASLGLRGLRSRTHIHTQVVTNTQGCCQQPFDESRPADFCCCCCPSGAAAP